MAKNGNQIDYQKLLLDYLSCRPVAYNPELARRVGGVKAGVMLSQLLYWTKDKSVQARDGWIYKSIDEMEEETALTKLEQQTARLTLAEFGVVESILKGMPRIWHYRINFDVLYQLLNVTIIGKVSHPMEKPFNGKPSQYSEGNLPNIGKETDPILGRFPTQLNRNQRLHTETTAETTAETTSSSYPLQDDDQEEEDFDETGLSDDLIQDLENIGVFPAIIQEIEASDWTEYEIQALLKNVNADAALENKAAGFVHRFRQGQKPKSTDDPTRYVKGEFGEFVKH